MDEQLSVTTWPGYPVPVPELPRYPEATLDGEIIWLENTGEMGLAPPELYLRHARQVDLQNPEALLHFVRTVGGVPYAFEDRDLFPYTDPKEGRELFAISRNREYVEPQWETARWWGVHLDEVAFRLRILDLLGRHAVAYRRGDYLAPVWKEGYARGRGDSVNTEQDAWHEFAIHANPALQIFHVRLRVLRDGIEIGGWGPHTFLEAGVLQMVNDLADEVDYLTCPNCGLIFARQVGQSTHYSRRAGVTYCSPKCATAARVKAYRARKRTERTS
jgi:predicted RNA-binding Zn-ribbon protein involved in translation (DUF1610 family)